MKSKLNTFRISPTSKNVFLIPLIFAFSFAIATASGTDSTPTTFLHSPAINKAIVPVPEYKS